MFSIIPQPEQYHLLNPTRHVPNSLLPVLIYRSCFPPFLTPDFLVSTIEPNNWLHGGTFKHYPAHHFHSVTHECYAIFRGSSTILLGRGPLDFPSVDEDDVTVEVEAGDAIVLPAGVAHCSIKSSEDYEYVGLYPKGSPRWDNNFCKAGAEETREKAANAKAVPIPEYDPIFGENGPLVRIWRSALVEHIA